MGHDAADQEHLKRAVFDRLAPRLAEHGFKLKRTKDTFRREHDGVCDMFHLAFLDNKLDGKPGWRVQPTAAVRNERVETIFHRTSGFEPKYQPDTATIGSFVGQLTSGSNSACEFPVNSIEDVPAACDSIFHVFTDFALGYFQRFDVLDEIDRELNSAPLEHNVNRGVSYFRCTTGVIVAKLVGRADYEHLVDVYTEIMRTSNKGFYLKRFQALVASLEASDT
ncbi:hypothetical protein [Lichenicola sp.]|uniref:hypothetical protein n=1 Tax=Lichenicola sp. TaxID=2804529 RepID=UPI003B0084C9